MRDVAQRAGVSQTTVSLVLNDAPNSGIPERTQARVREAANAVGYRTNRLARAMRLSQTDTIGFLSDDVATTPFASRIIEGAQEAAWEAGKLLLIVNTGSPFDGEHEPRSRDAVSQLLERQVDGIILAAMFHQRIIVPVGLEEVPSVLVDATCDDPTISSVVPNSRAAAAVATHRLIDAGHRRIGHITVDQPRAAAPPLRIDGYREALASADLAFDEALVVRRPESDQRNGRLATDQLLDLDDPPTAIFCFNDRMAMGVYQAAGRRGRSIPHDLSVIGFDDQALIAADLLPGLTTMRLPHEQMGRWAIERLLSPSEPEQRALECALVERNSVAPPPERPGR